MKIRTLCCALFLFVCGCASAQKPVPSPSEETQEKAVPRKEGTAGGESASAEGAETPQQEKKEGVKGAAQAPSPSRTGTSSGAEEAAALSQRESFAFLEYNGPSKPREEELLGLISRYELQAAQKPEEVSNDFNAAVLYGRLGNYERAVRAYERVLGRNPESREALVNLAGIYVLQGKLDEAAKIYDEILAKDPGNSAARLNRGIVYRKQKAFEKAAETFRALIRDDIENIAAHNNLALVYFDEGAYELAEAVLSNTLQYVSDRNAQVYNNLGLIAWKEEDVAGAIERFEKAIELDPDFAEAHNNLALVLLSEGKIDEAITHFEKALLAFPGLAKTHLNLGVAFREKGEYDKARMEYEKALSIDPELAEAYRNLAILYESYLDDTEKAKEFYEKYEKRVGAGAERSHVAID